MAAALIRQPSFPSDPAAALFSAFKEVDRDWEAQARRHGFEDGTTAIVALFIGEVLYVANTGDSRAILVESSGRTVELSEDHKPDRADEQRRITQQPGGFVSFSGVWRLQGILAVSRAIGDVGLKPYCIPDPDVRRQLLGPSAAYVVCASDGLWDTMNSANVAAVIADCRGDIQKMAFSLVQTALENGSTDNVTVLLVDVRARMAASFAGNRRTEG